MIAGDRLLDYVVDHELGEGGMGKVYLARHTVLDQQVAIKVLDPEVARKPDVKERFIQEANIQARLRHPGIVQVLTATQIDGGAPALVMEYVDGRALSEVLELRGALPVDDALKIMMQILSAVGYAHQQGVIHRDLKPSNVMVMATGEAKVTDFGIAKVLGSTRLTRTGTAMGSAHYMSPEQIRRPEAVDVRSDIYSLGCVFYEILTGQPPFGGKEVSGTASDFEIKTAHVSENALAPGEIRKNIPAWLDRVIMQALEKDSEQRQASCEEILSQLKAAGEQSGTERSVRSAKKSTKPEAAWPFPTGVKPARGTEKNSVDAGDLTPILIDNQVPPKASKVLTFSVSFSGVVTIAVLVVISVVVTIFFKKNDDTKNTEQLKIERTTAVNQSTSEATIEAQEKTNIETENNIKILEDNAINFIKKLFSTWSESDEKAYAFLEYVLADKIFFYGENKYKNEILKLKLNFMRKWNSREYTIRLDTLKTQCDLASSRCVIDGILDWKAVSRADNLSSEGVATFEYGLDFSGESPKIYRESSKVLKREISNL